jgi:hypothetical protein
MHYFTKQRPIVQPREAIITGFRAGIDFKSSRNPLFSAAGAVDAIQAPAQTSVVLGDVRLMPAVFNHARRTPGFRLTLDLQDRPSFAGLQAAAHGRGLGQRTASKS